MPRLSRTAAGPGWQFNKSHMTIFNLTKSELTPRIQENMIAYMRLFGGLDGMLMEDVDGAEDSTFWFICKKPGPGHCILRARWSQENIEERIDALFARIGRHFDEIDWQVYPGVQPSDLSKRLEARGMPAGRGGNWMWASLENLVPPPSLPPGFRVKRVTDNRMMEEWLCLSLAGFAGKEVVGFQDSYAELASFYDAYARHGYGPLAFSLHYLGYLGDQAVTSGTLLDAGGTAAIYDVSTPPMFRRQGFGSALTYGLMEEIRRRGYRETWIWGSDEAKGVYQRLGFVEADFGIRVHRWRSNR
jgi:ribosomal protein S18 acetylase RimI-like enzyme